MVQCTETLKKGPRYLEMAEGYVTGIALDADDEIIGYQFVNFGRMMDFIKAGDDAQTALDKAKVSTDALMTLLRLLTQERNRR